MEERTMDTVWQRVADLEAKAGLHATEIAVLRVQLEILNKNVEKINASLTRANWLLITIVVGGMLQFYLKGGGV